LSIMSCPRSSRSAAAFMLLLHESGGSDYEYRLKLQVDDACLGKVVYSMFSIGTADP
jgi:hypothetical protein